MRILITGSRTWTDDQAIWSSLYNLLVVTGTRSDQAVLVSGGCPKGADQLAEVAAKQLGIPIERHPADWAKYGKRAGFVRNAEMVMLGADYCFAYIHNASRGATMTADLAEKAGIPLRRYELND